MERGVLYFLLAGNKNQIDKVMHIHGSLLRKSTLSLKKHMPEIPNILFTNIDSVDWKSFGIDKVVYKYEPSDVWVYKYECLLETPFKKTIHLDCDTYMCDSFVEVFDMLDSVDFAVPFSPYYFGKRKLDVPFSFPEFAGGFMAYVLSDKVKKLYEDSKVLIENRGGGCDEPYLRKALYESDVRFSVLPWEYTCVFLLPGFLFSKVKVLHGKYDNVESLESRMAVEGPKLFTGEKLIHTNQIGRKRYEMGLVETY